MEQWDTGTGKMETKDKELVRVALERSLPCLGLCFYILQKGPRVITMEWKADPSYICKD